MSENREKTQEATREVASDAKTSEKGASNDQSADSAQADAQTDAQTEDNVAPAADVNGEAASARASDSSTAAGAAMEDAAANTNNGDNGGAAAEAAADSAQDDEAAQEEMPDSAAIIQALQEQLVQAEAKAKEHFDMLQRTAAEFQNSKRRQEKLLADSIDRASMHLIQRLLPVLDDLDLAFRNQPQSLSENESAWTAGFQQIQKKLMNLLEDESVTLIPPTGEFDPNRHEAISSEPSEEVESGHIIETLRTGYEHKGRVLRPAIVRVAM